MISTELATSFRAILSNPESPAKLQTDTLRTLRYSYPQDDPTVIELVTLAVANGVAEPATTDSGAAGLATYDYCDVATMQAAYGADWRQQDVSLSAD